MYHFIHQLYKCQKEVGLQHYHTIRMEAVVSGVESFLIIVYHAGEYVVLIITL